MQKLKILQINVCLNVLSTGRITEQIGLKIMEKGWNSYVLTYGPLKESQSYVIKVTGWLDRYIHRVINRFFDAQGYGSYFATKIALKRIKQINPDIIHLQNIHDCWLNHKLLFDYIRENNKPVVWTFHDCWAFTGHCAYFDDVECMRWENGCFECPLKNRLSLDLSNYNFRRKKKLFGGMKNMTIVPVSFWLEEITKDSFLGKFNVTTIHNGIDIQSFKPRKSNLREILYTGKKFVLLGVSACWGESKGLYDFVELSKDPNYVVILIGLPESFKNQIPNDIITIERTDSQEQLAEYYSMADVFVNPTYHDNYPTVNLEAIACGTPMVGYNSGGNPEALYEEVGTGYVLNPQCGIIVERGNFEALHNAIESLRNEDEGMRLARRGACRKHAEKYFDKDKCYERYIDLYTKMIKMANNE